MRIRVNTRLKGKESQTAEGGSGYLKSSSFKFERDSLLGGWAQQLQANLSYEDWQQPIRVLPLSVDSVACLSILYGVLIAIFLES